MKKLRIYCDTSVFGGCFDEEFARDSTRLFEEFNRGLHILILSDITLDELQRAPLHVRELFTTYPNIQMETIAENEEIIALRDAYLKAGVVGPSSTEDASHVAAATVAEADVIVSWNFKHIVHFQKIKQYNAINMFEGYAAIAIYSPREVIENEE